MAGQLPNPNYTASAIFNGSSAADLVVNNLDGGFAHPYHLHGRSFFLVKRGSGNLTAEQWEASRDTEANVDNPLRRDVITIPVSSYAVLSESSSHRLGWLDIPQESA